MSKWNEYELAENNMGSANIENIETKQIICNDMVIEDRPMFFAGRNAGHITTDIIIDFNDVQVDTHSAYKGGVWQCPKDGVYDISVILSVRFTDNGTTFVCDVNCGEHKYTIKGYKKELDSTYKIIDIPFNIKESLTSGDLIYVKGITVNANVSIFGDLDYHSRMSITYLGA